jgi:hypothetical protein
MGVPVGVPSPNKPLTFEEEESINNPKPNNPINKIQPHIKTAIDPATTASSVPRLIKIS